jgi:hypothetical protein
LSSASSSGSLSRRGGFVFFFLLPLLETMWCSVVLIRCRVVLFIDGRGRKKWIHCFENVTAIGKTNPRHSRHPRNTLFHLN